MNHFLTARMIASFFFSEEISLKNKSLINVVLEPYKDADVRAYSFDVIVFAALLLQLRMIVSWLVIAYIDVTTFETFWELENSENSFFLIFL